MTDAEIKTILRTSRTFAVVGASNDASRPSYGVTVVMDRCPRSNTRA